MDKVLKQRLLGAAILIALAVIFVPMLFDEGPERSASRDTVIDLPPPPSDRRELRRLPLDPERARDLPVAPLPETLMPERTDSEISLLAPAPAPELEQPPARAPEPDVREVMGDPPGEPIAVAEPPAESARAVQAAPAPERPRVSAAGAAEARPATPPAAGLSAAGWMVQVASFSSAETADRIAQQLGRLGHAAAVDVIVRGDSRLHRVRTGPYAARAEADQARAQIATTVAGVQPVVVAAAEVPVAARPGAAAGWAVQVGSFTARANADRLTEQLRGQGFDAFIHPDEAGSRAIWRVRVGTLARREEAARLQADLLDRAGLEGMLVSHP